MRSALSAALTATLTLLLAACSGYGERVAPIPLPSRQALHVDSAGALFAAQALVSPAAAQAALGFDARDAGLLPVRFVIDNQGNVPAEILPEQTFLIDAAGAAWPLLTTEQAYRRIDAAVGTGETLLGAARPAVLFGAAGAVLGFAVGVLTGEDIGNAIGKGAAAGASVGALSGGYERHQSLNTRIRSDLARHQLQNRKVAPGQLAYGYLFFPGRDEAESAASLRLAIRQGQNSRVLQVPLPPTGEPAQ